MRLKAKETDPTGSAGIETHALCEVGGRPDIVKGTRVTMSHTRVAQKRPCQNYAMQRANIDSWMLHMQREADSQADPVAGV